MLKCAKQGEMKVYLEHDPLALAKAIYSVLRKGSEPGKLVNLEAAVEKIAFNVNRLTEVLGKFGDVEDPLRLAQGQKKLGDYVR